MYRASLSPLSALVAHTESLVTGARILVVGNAENSLAEHLLERGARLVQVLDAEPRRVAQAAANNSERRVNFAPLTDSALRDASYDCAIVEDLADAVDPKALVAGIRRAVGSHGIALIACSSDESVSGLLGTRRGMLGFTEFSEAVHATFERVLLVAQTPFIGYAVVHLDLEEPPEPALDNGYLTGESDGADFYIAIAGRTEVVDALEFEDMSIVQLPARDALGSGPAAGRAADQRAQRRIEVLEAELKNRDARGNSGDAQRLQAELDRQSARSRELEARAAAAEARASSSEHAHKRLEKELKEATESRVSAAELDDLRERADAATRESERNARERRWADDRVKKLEQELERALGDLDEARSATTNSVPRAELDALTTRLRAEANVEIERGRAYAAGLAQDKREQAKEIERLTAALDEAQSSVGTRTDEEFEALSSELDRQEQQLQERGRAVAALEAQLQQLEVYSRTLLAEARVAQLSPVDAPVSAPESESIASSAGPSTAELDALRRDLDALARTLAEREADLQAASWTIGALHQRLNATGA